MANEPYQPLSINTGSAQQAIQSTAVVTPALENLMQGIASGMISLGDLQKRNADIPVEAARRREEMADLSQIRPLRREVATAQLQNIQAAEAFEAETLPVLNATKRAVLEKAHQNAVQFGVPEEILKVFYATVPNFIPFDPDKLHDKKTGQVNIPYANEMIQKAKSEAAKMQMSIKFTGPVSQKTTDASGKMTEQTTIKNQLTGQDVGVPITTETKERQPGDTIKEFKSTRTNKEGTKEEDVVYRINTVDGAVVGETVLGSTPVKMTHEQSNALQFSDRMGFNNNIVKELSTKGFDPTALRTTMQSWFPNRFQPEALQSFTAAKDNWITAALRKESGALITPAEHTQANKQYFARDGDTPAVVAQKEALRLLVEEDIRLNSPTGGFWNPGGGRNQNPATVAAASGQPAPAASAPVGENPVVTVEQARTLPPTVKFFRLVEGGPLKWNPAHPESPTQARLRAAPVAQP